MGQDENARQVLCRECGRLIEVPSSVVEGQHVRCAYCFRKFTFSEAACVQANVKGRSEDIGNIAIKCPECRRMIKVPPTVKEGQHVLCPHCATKFGFMFDVTMRIPSIDLSFLSRGSLTIKCEQCGEYIDVDDNVEIGQHVLCPFCEKKFSYSGEDPLPKCLDESSLAKNEESKGPARKKDKRKIRKMMSRYQQKIDDREWVKSTITRALVSVGAFAAAVVLAVLYVQYHAEIDTRIELRNGLAEFIRSNHQMLTDRYSQYSLVIRNCRNDMWYSRDNRDVADRLRSRINTMLRVQYSIDEVERAFAAIAPRLDEMSVDEIKKTQDDLSRRIVSLSRRFENEEVDSLASCGTPEMHMEIKPKVSVATKVAPVASVSAQQCVTQPNMRQGVQVVQHSPAVVKRPDGAARLQAQIDKIVAELKAANYPFDLSSLEGMSPEEKRTILLEMLDDVRMSREKR